MKEKRIVWYLTLTGVVMLGCLCIFSIDVMAQSSHEEFQTTREDFFNAFKEQKTSEIRTKGIGGPESSKGISGIAHDQPFEKVKYEKLVERPVARSLILFDFDSATVKKDSYPLLQNLAHVLQNDYPEARLLIAGHTDSVGKTDYNFNLSERRARAVHDVLISVYGILPERLALRGFGETRPLLENKPQDGKNRRVEFIRLD